MSFAAAAMLANAALGRHGDGSVGRSPLPVTEWSKDSADLLSVLRNSSAFACSAAAIADGTFDSAFATLPSALASANLLITSSGLVGLLVSFSSSSSEVGGVFSSSDSWRSGAMPCFSASSIWRSIASTSAFTLAPIWAASASDRPLLIAASDAAAPALLMAFEKAPPDVFTANATCFATLEKSFPLRIVCFVAQSPAALMPSSSLPPAFFAACSASLAASAIVCPEAMATPPAT
mmetsp:Transcript_51428/g.143782  ORF Transcript_51428/g.143782 Transcript_51428/m.143782 type:complete len:235 (-) Transcript_51428:1413-2117(-)